jgi:HSP20 family protein
MGRWKGEAMKAQRKQSKPMIASLPIKKTEAIFYELRTMQDRIMRRAYDIFENSGRALGRDLEHWLDAERELVWKPAIELSEKDDAFHVSVAIPGVDPKALDIEVSPDYLLIKAEVHHEHTADKGKVHACEFETGSLFRSVRFPKKVDPNKVLAEFKNGMLYLTAPVGEAHLRKIEVKT